MATSISSKSVQDLLYIVLKRMAQGVGSVSGATFRMASTDSPQALTAGNLVDAFGNAAVAAMIVCETAAVRIALGGAVATQGATGVGVELSVGDSFYLDCPEDVQSFRFISSASGVAGAIQITPKF